MKRIYLIYISAILFCSCDILLPRPISGIDEYEAQELYGSEMSGVSNLAEDESGAVGFLEEFYKLYINCWLTGAPSSNYEKCLGENLLEAFRYFDEYFDETGYMVLDADPFIKAQDMSSSLRDGRFVIDRTDEANVYEMCYDNTCIRLYVVKENGRFVIDDVENETAGTICRLYYNMQYQY